MLAWVKSFQMYSRARIDEEKIKPEQMPHVTRQTSKTGMAKGFKDEWIPISPGKSQRSLKGEHKRRAETPMMVEHDPQKVHELQAKIAG